jgi:hypothetical protein
MVTTTLCVTCSNHSTPLYKPIGQLAGVAKVQWRTTLFPGCRHAPSVSRPNPKIGKVRAERQPTSKRLQWCEPSGDRSDHWRRCTCGNFTAAEAESRSRIPAIAQTKQKADKPICLRPNMRNKRHQKQRQQRGIIPSQRNWRRY